MITKRIEIVEVEEITDEIVAAFKRLVPQLATAARAPSKAELEKIVFSPATTVYIARDPEQDDKIVGALTLALFRIPTGVRAWIEDVVVDASARGKGIGEALCRTALLAANANGAAAVDLTSNPSREAANRLYQRMGFQKRETNVYRFVFQDEFGVRSPES